MEASGPRYPGPRGVTSAATASSSVTRNFSGFTSEAPITLCGTRAAPFSRERARSSRTSPSASSRKRRPIASIAAVSRASDGRPRPWKKASDRASSDKASSLGADLA